MALKDKAVSFLEDFKAFAVKGNVIDLAVAVVIGGAFGKIVTSFVTDIITPFMSLLTSGTDLSKSHWILRDAVMDPANPTQILHPELILEYGKFAQSIVDFLIIAFSIYVVIRLMGSFRRKQEVVAAPPEKAPDVVLLEEIRDLLKKEKE